MSQRISLELLRQALQGGFTKELFLRELLVHELFLYQSFFKGGWVSEEELIRLFLCHCHTKATANRWIELLVAKGWLRKVKNKYHIRAMWRILRDHGITGVKKLVVEVRETHMRSAQDFKVFCFDACCEKEILENWRRRYDPRYRIRSKRNKEGSTKFRPDPKSYSVSLGNELGLLDRNKGEYALRLAAGSLNISLAEAGRLAKKSEQKGECHRTQLFCPRFDELNCTSIPQLYEFIRAKENPAYHGRRFVKVGEKFRMKMGMVVQYELEFSYKRFKTI